MAIRSNGTIILSQAEINKLTPPLVERVLRLTLTPFNYRVICVVSNDVVASAQKRKHLRYEGDDDGAPAALHCHVRGVAESYIFLPFESPARFVAHEVFHCVWRVMQFIGAEFENEVMAYTLGYVVGEICNFVAKVKDPTIGTVPNSRKKR